MIPNRPLTKSRARDWIAWLQAKYETIERLNDLMGTRFWGQTVSDWDEVPMPMAGTDRAQSGPVDRTGGAFPATPALPSSKCRPTCSTNSPPTFP